MKGDFTRDTFDPLKHFSRVLMQQGRVQLDADWNEQASILLHYLQTLAADLIGPHGAPSKADGTPGDDFKIEAPDGTKDFIIQPGHYYVKGMLCENDEKPSTYFSQPYFPLDEVKDKLPEGTQLVYLDVWERHLTYIEIEDDQGSVISIREAALNGPDTATRAQVVWQVKTKALSISVDEAKDEAKNYENFINMLGDEIRPGTGRLKASAMRSGSSDLENPCITPPESRYRGAENQLYRVEIHLGGTVADHATFKWSRDNGSIIFPICDIKIDQATRITVDNLGRDAHHSLQVDDWVEIVDDDYTLQNRAEALLQIEAIDPDKNVITLKDKPDSTVGQDSTKHPYLRRWDQRQSENFPVAKYGIDIVEGTGDDDWIELEDGVKIQFQKDKTYRPGDYWLIPARTATGDVEWPGTALEPEALEPHGITHHYAPLGIITVEANSVKNEVHDLRRKLNKLWA
jgi:hypothetical protein